MRVSYFLIFPFMTSSWTYTDLLFLSPEMGDDAAAFYKALFTGQAERGEQTKKAASRRQKHTSAGPPSKRARKAGPSSLPQIPEEAGEEAEDHAVPLPEVPFADVPSSDVLPQSPTPSHALLEGDGEETPSAEERRQIKGKGISTEATSILDEDVTEVPAGLYFVEEPFFLL